MSDDGLAVANGFAVGDDRGQLTARRRRGVEHMLVREGQACQPQEGEDLQSIAVIVSDAIKRRIGIQADHDRESPLKLGSHNREDLRRRRISSPERKGARFSGSLWGDQLPGANRVLQERSRFFLLARPRPFDQAVMFGDRAVCLSRPRTDGPQPRRGFRRRLNFVVNAAQRRFVARPANAIRSSLFSI
jgi:hypothetical protein